MEGRALLGGWVGLRCTLEKALPHSPPPLWIPAFAGMTKWGAGMTMVGAGVTNGRPALLGGWVGLRCTGEGLPHSPPPLWIPAFAGKTSWGAGMTMVGAGVTNGRPALLGGWVGLRCTERRFATLPRRPSGFRPSPE